MSENTSSSQILPTWMKHRLAEYETIDYIPKAFDDSTHHLWRLQNSSIDKKNHFLKICSNSDSPFWQIMNDLFDFELRKEISGFSNTYKQIDNVISLRVPELLKSETLENDEAYVLTAALEGKTVTVVNDQDIQQLAKHLAELHSQAKINWGSLSNTQFNSFDWSKRLQTTLIRSSEKWGGVFLQSSNYLKEALECCRLIEVDEFVLMMPDLRWDQFLRDDDFDSMTALVDLDAFVFAPRELDFVILEYILTRDQISIFIKEYSKQLDIPEIESVRVAYRLLLFYMQILGETDLDEWMNKEALFQNEGNNDL